MKKTIVQQASPDCLINAPQTWCRDIGAWDTRGAQPPCFFTFWCPLEEFKSDPVILQGTMLHTENMPPGRGLLGGTCL